MDLGPQKGLNWSFPTTVVVLIIVVDSWSTLVNGQHVDHIFSSLESNFETNSNLYSLKRDLEKNHIF